MTNRELVEKYPFLALKIDYWTGKELSKDEIDPDNNWWEDIPTGWAKAFGIQMCDELLEILKEGDCVDDYCIVQIKEKFGGLRWYDNGVPESVWSKYREWLNKYEELSFNTCIRCGAPATHMTKGWIVPVCDSCETLPEKIYDKISSEEIEKTIDN